MINFLGYHVPCSVECQSGRVFLPQPKRCIGRINEEDFHEDKYECRYRTHHVVELAPGLNQPRGACRHKDSPHLGNDNCQVYNCPLISEKVNV